MSESKPSVSGGFLFPGIVAAAAAIIGYFAYAPSLESRRPNEWPAETPAKHDSDSVLTVASRLWEDPLGAVDQESVDDQTKPPGGQPTNPTVRLDFNELEQANNQRPVLVLPILLNGGRGPDAKELRMRSRYAVLAGLATAKYHPVNSTKLKHFRVQGRVWPEDLLVPFEQFLPDETDPLYDSHDDPHYSTVTVCWVDEDRLGEQPLQALTELIQNLYQPLLCNPPPGLLSAQVRILGPSASEMLLTMACEYAKRVKSAGAPGTLLPPFANPFPVDARMYSCRATVEPAALKSFIEDPVKTFTGRETWVGDNKFEPRRSGAPPITNVIGTDWHLAHALRKELKVRGVWPDAHVPNQCIVLLTEMDSAYGRSIPYLFSRLLNPADNGVELTVVRGASSGLTLQLRGSSVERPAALAGATVQIVGNSEEPNAVDQFILQVDGDERQVLCAEAHIRKKSGATLEMEWALSWPEVATLRSGRIEAALRRGADGRWDGEGTWTFAEPFVVFRYLRGIDGKPAKREEANNRTPAARRGDSLAESPPSDADIGWSPTGNSQRDYLRRLEHELMRLHAEQKRAGGKGIRAIGVVGTDVYDKLLILRAIRRSFPNVCFFTTDLDAELVLPSELPHTRNLIVASHFGLSLEPRLQRDVPPFRNSYQTSTFLSALLALHDDRTWRVVEAMSHRRTNYPGASAGPSEGRDPDFWPSPVIDPINLQRRIDAAKSGKQAPGLIEWLDQDPWQQVGNSPLDGYLPKTTPKSPAEMGMLKSTYLEPLIFEIGRHLPYQLTLTHPTRPSSFALPSPPGNETTFSALVHPASPRELQKFPVTMWSALGVVLILSAVFLSLSLTFVRRFFNAVLDAMLSAVWFTLSVVPLTVAWYLHLLWDCPLAPLPESQAGQPASARERGIMSARELWKAYCCRLLRPGSVFFAASQRDKHSLWPRAAIAFSTVLLGCFGWFVYSEHCINPDGEPFELWMGISVWPSTIIRIVVCILSATLLFTGVRSLRKDAQQALEGIKQYPLRVRNWYRLFKRSPQVVWYRLCVFRWKWEEDARRERRTRTKQLITEPWGRRLRKKTGLAWREFRVFLWSWNESKRGKEEGKRSEEVRVVSCPRRASAALVREYSWRSATPARLARSFFWSGLLLVTTLLLFFLTDEFPNCPARNQAALHLARSCLILSVFATVLLAFFAMDSTNLCRRLVIGMGRGRYSWLPRGHSVCRGTSTVGQCCPSCVQVCRGAPTLRDDQQTVKTIGRMTKSNGKLLYYPAIAVLLMILARHPVFDGSNFPLSLVGVVVLLFLILGLHYVQLRREAEAARQSILRRLRGDLLENTAAGGQEAVGHQIKHVMKEIEDERTGAFAPLGDDYLFRAMALVFGGGGALALYQLLPSIW